MHVVRSIRDLEAQLAAESGPEGVGLVPTMGAFHAGHVELIRRCAAECDPAVVSLFVNPAQFSASEDLRSYPRDEEGDAAMAAAAGASVLFVPDPAEVYPPGFQTWVDVGSLSSFLCGRSRPGHFRGVATIVAKLLQIVRPRRAYFGEKDFQQLRIVQQLVADLNIPTTIVPVPTVRGPDGLAMSSRNRRLSPDDRKAAAALPRALAAARAAYTEGERNPQRLRATALSVLEREPRCRVDYVEVVDLETLQPVEADERPILLAAATCFGGVRLIDNVQLPGREAARDAG